MKIVSSGSTISSPEYHEKKRKARRVRLMLSATVLVLILILLVVVSRQQKFLITKVSIVGAQVVNEDQVGEKLKEVIHGYYWWLFPRANALIYPSGQIERSLRAAFPRISGLSVSLIGSQELQISINEREPYALYCGSILKPEDASACYFLDENGLIFDHAPSFSGTVYFIYALETPYEEPLGQAYLPISEFKLLSKFVSRVHELGADPLAVEVGQDEINMILSNDAKLVWLRGDDISLIYSNLEAFLTSDAIRSEKDFFSKIALLDLRTENKVFYRFK